MRRAITWAGSEWHEGAPKSRAGVRTVPLPTLALELLARLPSGEGYIFMQELCQMANVPRRPAHYLRHYHDSLLAVSGLDVKSLQRRLGHFPGLGHPRCLRPCPGVDGQQGGGDG